MLTPKERLERESISRYHRILRYENRLIKEGFRFASEHRIRVLLPDTPDGVDATALADLGARTLPSLYRRTELERSRLEANLQTLNG